MNVKPRIAVVSPFLDKRHGTERCVTEQIERLADDFEIHVYSQRIEDIDRSRITWHRIPKLAGPHLFNFLWWFAANRLRREWDSRVRGMRYDLVFSPGVNCFDADAISVHIVFAEYMRKIDSQSESVRQGIWSWPQLLHRRLYYRLAVFLERRAYTNPDTTLILNSKKASAALAGHYCRRGPCPIIYLGLDHETFNPARRVELRDKARKELGLCEGQFVLLLIGNDWHNKGGPVLLDALVELRDLNVDLLLVSNEDQAPLRAIVAGNALDRRVHVLPPRKDVEFYYAAADAYVGPSLEDTFALPPAEAMACGLPVIVSASTGVSETVTNSVDGLILDDPTDASSLAAMIRSLYQDEAFRARLGVKAAETARQYTWERNGRELAAVFEEILRRKSGFAAHTLTQEL